MNLYNSIDELWLDVITDLVNARPQKSRDGGTREIIGWSGQLTTCEHPWLTNPRRALSVPYAAAELVWYLSGSDSVKMMEPYAPSYGSYVGGGDTAYGGYGKRLNRNKLLEVCAEILSEAPESRQVVALIWEPKDIDAARRRQADIPCTISLQFLLRDKRLHCVTNMRSNDAWLGLPYDVFCFTSIQRLLAGQIGMIPGTYTHNVGSMHLYDRNYNAATQAQRSMIQEKLVWFNDINDCLTNVHEVIAAEKLYRDSGHEFKNRWTSSSKLGPMLSDLIEVFRCFWAGAYPGPHQFNSIQFQRGMEAWKRNTDDSQS